VIFDQFNIPSGPVLGVHLKPKDWAQHLYEQFAHKTDDFPRPGTHWFCDFFYPIGRDYGGAQVMVRFFELLAKHFPKKLEDNGKYERYSRPMNWGEFIHFMSGAAHKDLRPLAKEAFGWPVEWEAQYRKAREDFPEIEYKA
jgi:hypothetical protein